MTRSYLMSIFAVLAAVVLAGCAQQTTDVVAPVQPSLPIAPASQPLQQAPAPTQPNPPVPTATFPPVPTPKPVNFSGSGDELTAEFDLTNGLLVLEASHSGSGNFIVQLLSAEGDRELSINAIGAYSGVRGHQVKEGALFALAPGAFRVEVNADGPWTVDLSQPQWNQGADLPVSYEGDGDTVMGPFRLVTGLLPAEFSHSGSGNFMVQLASSDGESVEFLVNEIGAYQGSQAITVRDGSLFDTAPGIYALVVNADGPWTVSLGN